MILVDMSNLAISSLQQACAGSTGPTQLTATSVRHIVLKKLIEVHKKIGRHHSLVLCFDSRNYWRKDFMSCYKASRKRTNDQFSWEEFYAHYNAMKIELPLYFNYKCIEVERVEADDIIFCISEYERGRNVIIASSDTDDLQILEKYPEAAQFSIKHNKFITCEDYNYSLLEHIIEGDKVDTIANILSDEDTYVNPEKRSKALTKQKRASLKFIIPEEYKARYEQNKKIIDMSQIPDNYRQQILDAYLAPMPKRIGNTFEYCVKYKLGQLLKIIN